MRRHTNKRCEWFNQQLFEIRWFYTQRDSENQNRQNNIDCQNSIVIEIQLNILHFYKVVYFWRIDNFAVMCALYVFCKIRSAAAFPDRAAPSTLGSKKASPAKTSMLWLTVTEKHLSGCSFTGRAYRQK